MDENRAAWNRHAQRYFRSADLPHDTVDYNGPLFPTESDLNLIGDPAGLRVLELGSGACNCGIALARQGAQVTCLDLSAEMLELGRQSASKAGVSLQLLASTMTDLSPLRAASYDLVLSVCALQYVEEIDAVFGQVARVLSPGGRFVFSTDHPMAMALGAVELWPEDGDDPLYSFRGPVRWKWDDADDFFFTTYRRPTMDYINALARAGFSITQMHELHPKHTDPDWSERELSFRTRVPTTLVVAARKP